MWRPDDFLALPEDVTAFAWSAPMRELAQTIGISDVALKKLLRAKGIVTPPQGHWNRVHAGRKVPAPPAPRPRGPGETGRVSLDRRFRGHVPEAAPMPIGGPFASARVPEDLGELRARELEAFGRVMAPRDLARPAAGLARLLRTEAARREKAAASGWTWNEPHFDTPLGERQMRLLSGLFSALARRDHRSEAWEENEALRARCTIGDEPLRLRVEIAGKHRSEERVGYQRPARDLPARTPLRLVLDRSLRVPLVTAWSDEPDRPLEKQLAEIAADLVVAAEASFRQGLIEARARQAQSRRWEEARRREELKELEGKRLADLKTSGELLRQAEEIRALVARVEQAMRRGSSAELTVENVGRWKQWALSKADELDPVQSGQVLEHLYVAALDGISEL
jgi:hypothetical protein